MRKAIHRRLVGNASKKSSNDATAQAASYPSQPTDGSTVLERRLGDFETGHSGPKDKSEAVEMTPNEFQAGRIGQQDEAKAIQGKQHQNPASKPNMWSQAYEQLQAANPDLVALYEAILVDDPSSVASPDRRLSVAVARKRDEMISKQWTIKFMNHRLKVREQVQRIAKVAEYVQGFGSVVANVDPIHAGLPWAGINVLLTVRRFFTS